MLNGRLTSVNFSLSGALEDWIKAPFPILVTENVVPLLLAVPGTLRIPAVFEPSMLLPVKVTVSPASLFGT